MKDMKKYQNLIIAHRGIHNNKEIPENSLLSFKKAIEKHIPIEFDIQVTKDNQLIVFHDENTKRMTNQNYYISELSLSEIKKLNLLNTKEKIPTFKEVLNLVNGQIILDIELKNTKKIKTIVTLVLQELKDYKGEFIIKSFNPNIIKYMKMKNKSYTYGLLLSDKQSKYLTNNKLLLAFYKPDFLAISKKLFTKKNIQKYYKKYPIFIWTIQNKEQLLKYKKNNYSYICNNLPYQD